jgi:hypothetical protein
MYQGIKILTPLIFLLRLTFIFTYSYLNVNAIEPIKVIDLHSALSNNIDNSSNLDIFSKIKYVKLETNKNCIIGEFPRFFCDDDIIIANSFQKILFFNKNTGEFNKEIGKFDKSPRGYGFTISTLAFNEEDKIIYAGEWDFTFCGYNFNNKKIIHIKPPFRYINSIGYINNSIYAGFVGSNMGGKEMRMAVFKENGDIINIFPNYLPYASSSNFHFNAWEGIFYRFKAKLNFKEIYNDTLFQVNTDALIPRYVFKMGKYSPPPEKRSELERIITRNELGNVTRQLDNYIESKVICESVRYLFFEFRYQMKDYWGFYDKKTEETYIKKSEDNIIMNGIEIPYRLTRAFINQKNQELVTFIDAYQLIAWMKSNPEKLKALPQEVQKQIKEVKESDNPVVIIAKLKE